MSAVVGKNASHVLRDQVLQHQGHRLLQLGVALFLFTSFECR
jgi:hypothetical protein